MYKYLFRGSSCTIIVVNRRGLYVSYRDLQLYCSRPVIGLLGVFALCFYFIFIFCIFFCCFVWHEMEGAMRVKRDLCEGTQKIERKKIYIYVHKRRAFLLGTSSDVGLFMYESDGARKLNGRHSGGIRLQFLSVFWNDYRNPLCWFADVWNPYVFYARVLRMENMFALCVCFPP